MTTNITKTSLPEHIAKKVRETMFSRYSSAKPLEDEALIGLTEILAPYYPLDESQKQSALELRRWLSTREMLKASREPIDRLQQMVSSAVQAWERQVDRQEERRYRTERGYQNEYDERKAFLFKELRHRLDQGDYRVIEDMIAQLLPANGSIQPPSISIPQDFAEAVKQLALSEREQLSKLIDQTASARQVLSDYIHKIVADEKIEPEKSSK